MNWRRVNVILESSYIEALHLPKMFVFFLLPTGVDVQRMNTVALPKGVVKGTVPLFGEIRKGALMRSKPDIGSIRIC
jgi:hypothetical protein